ncbi:hypothetical protein AB0C76_29905 [Kitasatospora sp. NPDC048722]|uniref:hypothetical protein n=1 Tax=Kitasatospora sp. NPDC048722 TaxID=3155639 RepID=UPI0033E57FFC
MGHPVREWLDDAWARTRIVQVIAGGEGEGRLSGRDVLGWIEGPDELAQLRALTAEGRFTGDVCRCPGSVTLSLHDADGEPVGSGTVHSTDVAWERARFRDNLTVADPVGLMLFLAGRGAPGLLLHLVPRLSYAMGLGEGVHRTRQAGHGPYGSEELARRQVPASLRPALAKISGRAAGQLPEAQVDAFREQLAADYPDPAGRAVALLTWLGGLPHPTEAGFGEGVLVLRLLEGLDPVRRAAALPQPLHDRVVLGLLRWAWEQPADVDLVGLVEPTVRALLG